MANIDVRKGIADILQRIELASLRRKSVRLQFRDMYHKLHATNHKFH